MTALSATERRAGAPAGVDWGAVVAFVVVAFGAAWLIASPLWLSGRGLDTPGAVVYMAAMMTAPSLATAFVVFALRRGRGDVARRTGLRSPGGIRSWWRWGLLAWLTPLALVVLALLVGTAVGVFHPDLTEFSGLREMLAELGVSELPVPLAVLAAAQIMQALIVGWINLVPAMAEEWGWRGWLLPALLPLGRWPAIALVGVIWGLWHAPVILLGYNYPDHSPVVALGFMVVFCVLAGALLGWLRLASGSLWPAAIGHGFVNAVAGLPALLAVAGRPLDNAEVGLLGWTGWVVMAAALTLAIAVRRRET